jgi:hypothetical protein
VAHRVRITTRRHIPALAHTLVAELDISNDEARAVAMPAFGISTYHGDPHFAQWGIAAPRSL